MRAYRTKRQLWGKDRSIIVAHYPPTARKQDHVFKARLESLRQELLVMRAKVRDNAPGWRDPDVIRQRYADLCESLHIASVYYELFFEGHGGNLSVSFRKNAYAMERKRMSFGRGIIVTDNTQLDDHGYHRGQP